MTEANLSNTTFSAAVTGQDHLLATICIEAAQLEELAMGRFDEADELPNGTAKKVLANAEGERLHLQAEMMAGSAADMPSTDIVGLLAKAQLVIALSGEADDEHGRLASSMARDICHLFG